MKLHKKCGSKTLKEKAKKGVTQVLSKVSEWLHEEFVTTIGEYRPC